MLYGNALENVGAISPKPLEGRAVRLMCRAIWQAAHAQVDAGSLAVFRIAFGLVGLLIVARFFAYGWIGDLYIEPAHHFTYLGFTWVRPWPGWGMYAHFVVLGLFALGIASGYRYRLCALFFFLGFTYVELLDKTAYLNHYYWASLVSLLMVFLPMHRSLSLDAKRQSGTLWGHAPAWAVWLLRVQLAAVYVFAGAAKLNADWLLGAQPLHIWLQDHTGLPVVGPVLAEIWTAYVFSWAGAFFDLTIVGWLMWRRTRTVAYVVLVAFHLMTYLLFPSIGVFPWMMATAALLFFPPDWPKRVLRNLRVRHRSTSNSLENLEGKHAHSSTGSVPVHLSNLSRMGRRWMPAIVAGVVAVYVAAQVALPLRHYAYPGNVRWNEEGYRFSWRVLLTEKVGMVEYRVHEPTTGRRWRVSPEDYLTPLQAERMVTQPDMILETAHIIARDFAAQGHEPVEVRADAFVSMNGRGNAKLVDSHVDLAAIGHGLGPKTWVLPER